MTNINKDLALKFILNTNLDRDLTQTISRSASKVLGIGNNKKICSDNIAKELLETVNKLKSEYLLPKIDERFLISNLISYTENSECNIPIKEFLYLLYINSMLSDDKELQLEASKIFKNNNFPKSHDRVINFIIEDFQLPS